MSTRINLEGPCITIAANAVDSFSETEPVKRDKMQLIHTHVLASPVKIS